MQSAPGQQLRAGVRRAAPRPAWPRSPPEAVPSRDRPATLCQRPASEHPNEAIALHLAGARVTERELIEGVLARDPAAERALYDAHVDRVWGMVYRIANDPERTADWTQETFVRVFQKIGDFRGEASLGTWIGSVAISVALSGLRKARRHESRELVLHDHHPAAPTRRADPDLATRLREAVAGLAEHYRMVFLLHDVEGYTHEEIAGLLGVETGTSKARLSRARARLREALAAFA